MTENESKLTYEYVTSILEYYPDTGVFLWLVDGDNFKKADVADKGGSSKYYRYISINDNTFMAHRVAWLCVMREWPKEQIDHVDHVKNNNIFSNLREVSNAENSRNMPLSKNNKSGVSGVIQCKQKTKWLAQINVNKQPLILGYFEDKFEAICARLSANNKYGYHQNHGR